MRLDSLNESFASKYGSLLTEAEDGTPWYGDELEILNKSKFEALLDQAEEKLDNDFEDLIYDDIWDTNIEITPGADPDFAHDDPYGSAPEIYKADFNYDAYIEDKFAKFVDSLLDDPDIFSREQQEKIKNNVDGDRDYLRDIFAELIPTSEDTFWDRVVDRWQEIQDDLDYWGPADIAYDEWKDSQLENESLDEGVFDTLKALGQAGKDTINKFKQNYNDKLATNYRDKANYAYSNNNVKAGYKARQNWIKALKTEYNQYIDSIDDPEEKIKARQEAEVAVNNAAKIIDQEKTDQEKFAKEQKIIELRKKAGFDTNSKVKQYGAAAIKSFDKCKNKAELNKMYLGYLNEFKKMSHDKINSNNSAIYAGVRQAYRDKLNTMSKNDTSTDLTWLKIKNKI